MVSATFLICNHIAKHYGTYIKKKIAIKASLRKNVSEEVWFDNYKATIMAAQHVVKPPYTKIHIYMCC